MDRTFTEPTTNKSRKRYVSDKRVHSTVLRRKRYREDQDYRERCIEGSRETYRKAHDVKLTSCLRKLQNLETHGVIRMAHFYSKDKRVVTFTASELAAILGYSVIVIYRWRPKQMLPDPIARAEVVQSTGKVIYEHEQDVYLLEEVREIVKVIGSHQLRMKTYRKSNKSVTEALYKAVEAVRKQYYVR